MLAMLRKEWMENVRGGRLLNLLVLFVIFGIMSPAIAKLTPWLMEMMAEEMAENGLVVTEVEVDALTSWTQFFKNIPMALLAYAVLHGTVLTKEFETGTLILFLTKGLARWKVIAAKLLMMVFTWTAGYWLCFGITYGYNAYFWDNSVAEGLLPAVWLWWVFGLWMISLLMLFSVLLCRGNGPLIGTGISILVVYLLSMVPKIKTYCPAQLMGGMAFIGPEVELPIEALAVTLVLTLAGVGASVALMNRWS